MGSWAPTDDTINTFKESKHTFLDSHAREHCVLDYPFGEASLCFHCFHYMERPQCKQQLSSIVQLSTCQLKILGKEEHDHTKDISKTIPVMVAAAKKIKENLMLAPVGQCASKLTEPETFYSPSLLRGRPSCLCPHHKGACPKGVNLLPATLLSPTKSNVCAVHCFVLHTSGQLWGESY